MIDFHRPWLLAAVPLVGVGLVLVRWGGARGMALADSASAGGARWWSRGAGGLATVARLGALSLLAAVAAGPFAYGQVAGEREGIAIVVALDVSESMREGRGPSESPRLEMALDELERFVRGRDGDLIGLVTFAGQAVGRVPPVTDRRPLFAAIESLRGEAPGDGTALGTAIGVSANRLRAVEARSKVVVAITDGESNAGLLDPVTAASAARALGVRTYTIGVGQSGAQGLVQVAEAGGGRSFSAADRSALDAAYREIDALETSAFAEPAGHVEMPRSAGFLWLASLLLVTEGSIRGSRAGRLG